MLLEVREQLVALNLRLARCDQQIATHARNSDVAKRAGELLGVGPVTSSALAATVPDAKVFRNGRQFGAWLGLTPRQHSSGGKTRLGHISLRGNVYLRTLLVQGARSTLQSALRAEPHARKPAATMDQATPRTQGLSQDADCDCQQACPDAVGDARKERTLRCRCVATPSHASAVTTRYSVTRLA